MKEKLITKNYYDAIGVKDEDLKHGQCHMCMLDKEDVNKYSNYCSDCTNESIKLHKKVGKELAISFVLIISLIIYFIINA